MPLRFTAGFPGLCLLAFVLPGCSGESPCGPSHGIVEIVVDGDTVVLAGGIRVRYLNVDTPEDTSIVECFGPEATAFNESSVLGREVDLTYDQQCTDRYGRLLAHVWSEGQDVGLDLVTEGHGCAMIMAPNVTDQQAFIDAQKVAMANGRGVWKWGGCHEPWPCRE